MATNVEKAVKTPETFQCAHLLAKDFDGTVARTFETSPNGLGVNEVHEIVIEDMFGINALEYYFRNGGLRNRAPSEIVREFAPDVSGNELVQLTTRFINAKLALYLDEIGTRLPDGNIWPRPTVGYLELREQLEEARAEGNLIDDLVLSSGHEPFINKTYEAWGAGMPTHVVAEETIRQLFLDGEVPVKPSPVLMQIAGSIWRHDYGIESTAELRSDEQGRIIFVGDDPVKDGELARNSGVDFVLLDSDQSSEIWRVIAARLQLGKIATNGIH